MVIHVDEGKVRKDQYVMVSVSTAGYIGDTGGASKSPSTGCSSVRADILITRHSIESIGVLPIPKTLPAL